MTNATYNAEQRALYDGHQPSAYSIVSTLSTNIGVLSLQDATSSYQQIVKEAKQQDPALSLPADVDPTILRGYRAQRDATLKQFESSTIGVGSLHWGTADSALVYHFKPLSRGSVRINSTNPLDNPLIDYRTATDPTDVKVYTALFRKQRQLFSAPSMQALGPVEVAPFGGNVTSDEQIAAVMRDQINPSNAHQCCTAAMLPRNLGGVVSHEQKVYGVTGLRVADISHWPMQISGAPMANMFGAAERVSVDLGQFSGVEKLEVNLANSVQLADLIKKEYCLAGACSK
jgi:choline dehydrogenase-like flavoprotein